MTKFQIRYGLGGGFGGCENKEWETINASDLSDAENIAYELACEEYYSYEGMHGLFNNEEALEEDPDLTEEDLGDMQREDMESWVDYEAREYTEEE